MRSVAGIARFALALAAAGILAAGCGGGGGSGGGPPGSVPSILRGPYLQLGSPGGASILWRTSEADGGAVRIRRADGSIVGEFAESGAAIDHRVDVAGLEPATTYLYWILSDGREIAGPFRLRTFPPPDADAIRFAAIGDCGMGTAAQEAVAERIRELDPPILLVAGDVVYPSGAAADYDPKFFEPYREILPETYVYPTLGNHDTYSAGGEPYLDVFLLPANNPEGTERYYSFDAGPCHVVAIDSNGPFEPGTPQHAWLDADLGSTDRRWTVAFLHHPPYGTSAIHDPDPRVRAWLVPLFDARRVDLVICGHHHNYERMFPLRGGEVVGADRDPDYDGVDGTLYVVTGGGGASLYPRNPALPLERSACFAERHHVVEVSIEGDCLRLRAIAAEGGIFDEVSFRKP